MLDGIQIGDTVRVKIKPMVLSSYLVLQDRDLILIHVDDPQEVRNVHVLLYDPRLERDQGHFFRSTAYIPEYRNIIRRYAEMHDIEYRGMYLACPKLDYIDSIEKVHSKPTEMYGKRRKRRLDEARHAGNFFNNSTRSEKEVEDFVKKEFKRWMEEKKRIEREKGARAYTSEDSYDRVSNGGWQGYVDATEPEPEPEAQPDEVKNGNLPYNTYIQTVMDFADWLMAEHGDTRWMYRSSEQMSNRLSGAVMAISFAFNIEPEQVKNDIQAFMGGTDNESRSDVGDDFRRAMVKGRGNRIYIFTIGKDGRVLLQTMSQKGFQVIDTRKCYNYDREEIVNWLKDVYKATNDRDFVMRVKKLVDDSGVFFGKHAKDVLAQAQPEPEPDMDDATAGNATPINTYTETLDGMAKWLLNSNAVDGSIKMALFKATVTSISMAYGADYKDVDEDLRFYIGMHKPKEEPGVVTPKPDYLRKSKPMKPEEIRHTRGFRGIQF